LVSADIVTVTVDGKTVGVEDLGLALSNDAPSADVMLSMTTITNTAFIWFHLHAAQESNRRVAP